MPTKKTNQTGSSSSVKKGNFVTSDVVGTSDSIIKRQIRSITTTSDFEQALQATQVEYAQIIKDLEDK